MRAFSLLLPLSGVLASQHQFAKRDVLINQGPNAAGSILGIFAMCGNSPVDCGQGWCCSKNQKCAKDKKDKIACSDSELVPGKTVIVNAAFFGSKSDGPPPPPQGGDGSPTKPSGPSDSGATGGPSAPSGGLPVPSSVPSGDSAWSGGSAPAPESSPSIEKPTTGSSGGGKTTGVSKVGPDAQGNTNQAETYPSSTPAVYNNNAFAATSRYSGSAVAIAGAVAILLSLA